MTFRSSARRSSSYGFLGSVCVITVLIAISAWSLMVTVGNVHHWWPFVPPMGYDVAISIVTLPTIIAFLFGVIKGIITD